MDLFSSRALPLSLWILSSTWTKFDRWGMLYAGVSARYGYDMNSLAVPRKAKEAIGGIASLQRPDGGRLTINVEYNLLDPLLRANGWADGDVNDDTGYSPFPGKHLVDHPFYSLLC